MIEEEVVVVKHPSTVDCRFRYSTEHFERVPLPKYDKIGEKRGDEILRRRLADPKRREEAACVLEKIDGSHFTIYIKRIGTNEFAFCYASSGRLFEKEDKVLFGDKHFYRRFLPHTIPLADKVERHQVTKKEEKGKGKGKEKEKGKEEEKVPSAEKEDGERDRLVVDFFSIYCEVYGDGVMKRVDYDIADVDLIAFALYVRDRRGKKLTGFMEYAECRQVFEGTGFPFLLPLFEGTFAEAFQYSEQNRCRVRGGRATQIEGHMLTMLQTNLRLKHKSDEFIRLESRGAVKGMNGEDKEVLKWMTRGTYYSVISKLGAEYAVGHPDHKKHRLELKKLMAEDAYSTWKEETESLESRNDESSQLKEGRPKEAADQKPKMPKLVLNLLVKEAEGILAGLEKEVS
jgi:hypothetical protein